MKKNIYDKTIEDFGEEWNLYNYSNHDTETEEIFKDYFDIFPWDKKKNVELNCLDLGCGTGRWSKILSRHVKQILLMDPSSKALNIAKQNLSGIKNVNFLNSKFQDAEFKNENFDFVFSLGVLHHMDNPFKGCQVLANCLNPGGLMKVALYSRSARDLVNDVREEIKELGVNTDPESIRRFRQMIIESEDQHHKAVSSFADFYCLSELRDLLFHVKEHQFTITEIEHMLTKLKLDFCGFESDRALNAFISQNPFPDSLYSLSAWSAFENQNQDVFSGMYQFWCQKRGDTSNVYNP